MVDAQRIGLPVRTRLLAIDTTPTGWRLWLGTNDYIHGEFIDLHSNGGVERVFIRDGESDEVVVVKQGESK